ncbi:MAG: SdrD B-like domain-containing protein, partial [Planctomycetota bacterium]
MGNYFVQFTELGGYHFSPTDQTNDFLDSDVSATGRFRVPRDSGLSVVDAGLHLGTSTIGDLVWEDRNGNGLREPDEPGIDGVRVHLFDAGGVNLIHSTFTNNGGHYFFGFGDVPGDYVVEVEAPRGFELTTSNQGADDRIDSDFDPASGRTTVTLQNEQSLTAVDAGLVRSTDSDHGTIGDFVWHDINGDGVQDLNEPGLDGVAVDLFADGIQLGTTFTVHGGRYSFYGLSPGDYTLRFVSPDGFDPSPIGMGGDASADSDSDPTTGFVDVVVSAGEKSVAIDAGFVERTSGEIGVVAGLAWDDLNNNGIQDAGEPGIAGVTASLFLNDPEIRIAQVETDAEGRYEFRGLPAGEFYVSFVNPLGYNPTAKDLCGDDAVDSDIDPLTRQSETLVLPLDNSMATADAGFAEFSDSSTAVIESVIWDDENQNGIRDAGEQGIDGVEVRLLHESGSTILGTTTTRDGGQFRFLGLTTYEGMVEVVAPFGYRISNPFQGTNNLIDSDIDSVTGRTSKFTLTAGQVEDSLSAGLIAIPLDRVIVSPAFAGTLPGEDPDGPGPAAFFGRDSFTSLENAVAVLGDDLAGTITEMPAGT